MDGIRAGGLGIDEGKDLGLTLGMMMEKIECVIGITRRRTGGNDMSYK